MSALFCFLIVFIPLSIIGFVAEKIALWLGYLDPWYDYGRRR